MGSIETHEDVMAYQGQGRQQRSNSDSSTANAMTTPYAARPRKRTAHACDACRLRKSRCDGRQPCSWCTENEVDCLYGKQQPSVTQGKSDQILETVLRMDNLLRSIHENLSTHRPSLIPIQPRSIRPVFTTDEAERLLTSFQRNVNFWYPTVSKATLQTLFEKVRNGFVENTCEDCAALLVMALGAASELIHVVYSQTESRGFELRQQQSELMTMASVCFDEAMKLLTVAYMEVNTIATQCIFLAALYCAFLQRPLQTWSHLNTAAAKCRSLIAYGTGSGNPEDDECIRRIFWSCYIVESDYISELSHLPQSGVADQESEVPLPGPLQTHFTESETESSALYFLSCISIRRLLNRVHHLLYAAEKHNNYTSSQNSSQNEGLKALIAELDRQLVLWHETLPGFLQFEENTQDCGNEHAAFLRQRYLACKSVIYRPYVEIVLKHGDVQHARETVEGAGRCLKASCDHIANLRSFGQTVMIDTWICSLSMTSTMFIILVSLQNPALRPALLEHNISEFGPHLRQLLNSWINLIPQKSPSIQQSIRLIAEIENLIEESR
ncbi:related to C6 transcription factor [Phialocephala subalpina]|uniref:Related to C6 transcription factor n=1 Tax=Phialocephala subalpina TaxID=576137 RepID=A0A1L7WN17_9HELO|nr:related to C6 transcription factor [Phialocephala subalpina]